MPLDLGKVRKPIRDLRRSLRNLPENPSVKAVHDLRTSSRKLESIVIALDGHGEHSTHQILKTVKPLRKAAGYVRDMDVLATKAPRLFACCSNDSVERLIAHLHAVRADSAQLLLEAVESQRKRTCHRLERISNQLKRNSGDSHRYTQELSRLIRELTHWPALSAENLHEFRIKIKELRYVLQLTPNSAPDFLKALDAVKTRIGDWHDWQQLDAFAREALTRKKDRKTLETVAEMEKQKFERAFKAAQILRARFLGGHGSLPHAEV